MSMHINSRLSRIDIVFNSFRSYIPDAAKEFSWTLEMSFCKISSRPRMLAQKFKGKTSFKQLKRSAHRHRRWKLDEKMHMVRSNVQLVNFTSPTLGSFSNKALTIDTNSKKFEWVHKRFTFPNKMESVLPEGMVERLQIHFSLPAQRQTGKPRLNEFFSLGATSAPNHTNKSQELNLVRHGDSSLGLKAKVSAAICL